MVTKNFRVWAWARRPSPMGPNVAAATVATMGGREGNDRRGQDRRYQKAREGRGERRLDRPGHRGLRAHGGEVPEGDRPLREAAGGRQGARVAPARALRGADRLVAAGGPALLARAAPHREEGLRPPRRGGGLRGLVLDRQEVREAQARGARRRARRPRSAGVPAARLAPGRVPGRLRAGGLPRARRRHPRPLPRRDVPALKRRARAGLLGRDRGVRLPGAPERLRVPRGRAAAGRVRQRHRGRPQGRRRDKDLGALPAVRRAPRARPRPRQPPLGEREGVPRGTRSARSGATSSSRSRRSGT